MEPVAYLFLRLDMADSWMGDLCEKRLRLKNSGYYIWVICLYDIIWTADLGYSCLAERFKLPWR